jgi:hypothetical protein
MNVTAKFRVESVRCPEKKDSSGGVWHIAVCKPLEKSSITMETNEKKGEAFVEKYEFFVDSPDHPAAKILQPGRQAEVTFDQLHGQFKNEDGKWYGRNKIQFLDARAIESAAAKPAPAQKPAAV